MTAEQPANLEEPTPASVLLVDDNPANLIALEAILGSLPVRLVKAHSGTEALRCVLDQDFAVILMDVRMPDLDGFETGALIKQRRRNRDTPIIFLSAFNRDVGYIARGYRQGAVDYLIKPYEPEILRSKVSVFVDLHVKSEQIKRQESLLRRQEREALTRETEHRFRMLTDSMPLSVIVARPSGAIYYNNQPWSQYSGDGPARGAMLWELAALHPEERPAVRAAWEEAARTGEPFALQCRLRRQSDGAYRWHLARAVPERDARGELQGWILAATDIDDQRQAEEALERLLIKEQDARREAEAASHLKDEFLAIVSHELRTPLTAILGWAKVLRSDRGSSVDVPRALATIERNALAQARLVDDLLDVSRIVTGKLRLDVRALDLRSIIVAAVDAMRPAAEAKEIVIDVDLAGAPSTFSGDAGRLQQVVSNVLSNAVKFTPGRGRVTVRMREIEGQIELSVIDTGPGIPEAFLPHVFEAFRQADGTAARAHGGLGLGLALVRSLVEMHGGAVRAENGGASAGAVFTITLPLHRTSRLAPEREGVIPVETRLEGIRVLVVDDEADTRELITMLLERSGAEVEAASSAADAFDILRERAPDVLLSDLGMPHEDGYSLIRRVRSLSHSEGGAVPAAAITAYAEADVGERARSAGFQAHVAKPVDPAMLAALVASLAGAARAEGRSERAS
ncbi:Chemotaxis protein methyltransferase CheR [Minicystis rosea]|nr:Chemotaxis protein methyltransferase CheR [Minicystis rosea]